MSSLGRPGLPSWQAALWVVLAGIAAQLAGGAASGAARAALVSSGRSAEAAAGLASPWIVLPAMLVSGLALLGVALFAPMLAGVSYRVALGLAPVPLRIYGLAALGTVMLGPLADLLMSTMQRLLPDATMGVVEMLNELARDQPLLLLWPVFALLPGLAEELLFRGLLQRSIRRPRVAILVSALAFSAFHVDPHHVAGVLPLGFFLAWVASRTSTSVSIVAHVVNNTVALMAVRVPTLDVGYGTEQEMPVSWVLVSLLLCAACVRAIVQLAPTPGLSAPPTA